MPEDAVKTLKDPVEPDSAMAVGAPTDEDILRLRSRLAPEFGAVAQKLVDAEAAIAEIEASLHAYESGAHRRPSSGSRLTLERATDKITARLKAVGAGISSFKDWVQKRRNRTGDGPTSPAPAAPPPMIRKVRDLQTRLEEAVRGVDEEIRDKERLASEVDRRLHEAQKELIRHRADEQQVREMQIRIGQTKQLSEDLERKMAVLDEMVRTFESKAESGTRTRSKDAPLALPRLEDRLQGTIDQALKAVAAQERKIGDLEKEVERAQAVLVEERARQQRLRGMQLRLRQVRHFAADLQCSLGSLGATIVDFSERAEQLLRPEKEAVKAGAAGADPAPGGGGSL